MNPSGFARFFREGHALHGVQIVVALVAAYAVSAALGLHENWWAALSALIVIRGNADATLSAGWQRMAATMIGSLCGLGGTWLVHHAPLPAGGAALTLAVVSLLAFATADRPGLRSAPIAALIVMSAVALPGVSPFGVALMRTVEIVIGAATAMAVVWLAHKFSVNSRPLAVVSGLLRELAAQVVQAGDDGAEARSGREARGAAVRASVRRLGEMVAGSRDPNQRALLGLAMRLAQDAALLARQLEAAGADTRTRAAETARAAAAALEAAAARLDGAGDSPAAALGALARQAGWPADAVQLLREDLGKLLHVAGAR